MPLAPLSLSCVEEGAPGEDGNAQYCSNVIYESKVNTQMLMLVKTFKVTSS